jgi:16S rRNA processing protein RimM
MTAGRVLIGRILKAHGIQGEVTFAAAGNDPGSLRPGLVAYLGERGGERGDGSGDESLTLRSVRAVDRFWLLCFDEVRDRDSAESLTGRALFVDEESLPPLPEGEYYQFQLVGRVVTRSDGNELGRVSRVIDMPGHDLLEVQGPAGELLVPMRREFVEWIDLERGEIRLADRADLFEAQGKAAPPDAGPPHRGTAPFGWTRSFEGTAGSAGQRVGNPARTRRRRPRPDRSSESAS